MKKRKNNLRANTLILIYLNYALLITFGIVFTINKWWSFVVLAFASWTGFKAYESFKELTTKNLIKQWKKKT